VNASIKAYTERYNLLPYLYTLLFLAHTEGRTVVRSLAQEFPTDSNTYTINFHFMWGPALLITPVVDESVEEISAYFPNARWFDYYTGAEVTPAEQNYTLSAPLDGYIPLHVRGGNIIPTQTPSLTAEACRQNPLSLWVVLDENYSASGSLFWDDGESVVSDNSYRLFSYSFSENTLTMRDAIESAYEVPSDLYYDSIRVFGLETSPAVVLVDEVTLSGSQLLWDEDNKLLTLVSLRIQFGEDHAIVLSN
jgi:maltase-glucoamylase